MDPSSLLLPFAAGAAARIGASVARGAVHAADRTSDFAAMLFDASPLASDDQPSDQLDDPLTQAARAGSALAGSLVDLLKQIGVAHSAIHWDAAAEKIAEVDAAAIEPWQLTSINRWQRENLSLGAEDWATEVKKAA